ncbi:hypothetical protein PV10_08852 [Exophiala mesophila]|uniref:Uncharacterized protein n=1 Tax=Exophiala mesophila TaxID=212818 RepID=A0A0D1Z5V4_EXOME|nr:uncharacterized protein PV10_08852 [Exophiala mesophila]KIV89274.1 hypothetical protein PV10_08852 [Exophiala mesophila]
MRYQDWDVLLFPAESRVPVQEFDTKCFALDQKTNPNTFESMTLVPSMTCFITSLEHGTPFRISVHSWQKPVASSILRAYKTPEEKTAFEARIYVDGVLQSQRLFDQENAWPEVIDSGIQGEPLLFPPFHKSVMQQPHWEPGDVIGRIKLVIAEGIIREDYTMVDSNLRLDRLRDVVSFSFQHAPLDVLQFSGIAWPSMRMFGRIIKQPSRPAPISSRLPTSPILNHQLHSHSPSKPSTVRADTRPRTNFYDGFQRRLNAHVSLGPNPRPSISYMGKSGSPSGAEFSRLQTLASDDPFTGPQPIATRVLKAGLRRSSQDISMPDYGTGRAEHSRSHTSMSGVDYPRDDFVKHMMQANPREIVQILSPAQQARLMKELWAENTPGHGIHAPTNSPRSTGVATHSQLPIGRIRDSLGMLETTSRGSSHGTSNMENRAGNEESCADPTAGHSPTDIPPNLEQNTSDGANHVQRQLDPHKAANYAANETYAGSVRSRSYSSVSKRKRSSTSPGRGLGDEGRGIARVASSSSDRGSLGKDSKGTPTDGGVSILK